MPNFKFHLTMQNILSTFDDLGYVITAKKGAYNSEPKKMHPDKKGDGIRSGEVCTDYNAMYLYINIHSSVVLQLNLTRYSLSIMSNKEKITSTKKLLLPMK